MNGTELIAGLRRIDPTLTIVAATGLNNKVNALTADGGGIDHLLLKPYTAEVLMETMSAVLKKSRAEAMPKTFDGETRR
ncbi:MAG TPA: hypothetical protein VNM92_08305 [Thermoanaerobaculia bacterium]|nr:hypothetical protein [Thermoanaerobaculia bacterium]